MSSLNDYIHKYGGELRHDPANGTVSGYCEKLSKYFRDVPYTQKTSAKELHEAIKGWEPEETEKTGKER